MPDRFASDKLTDFPRLFLPLRKLSRNLMAAYTLEEVTSRRATREFLDLPKRLYRDEPHWICPLDQDIENRFHPETNELLRDGEATTQEKRSGLCCEL